MWHSFSNTFIEETVIFLLSAPGTFLESQSTVNMWVNFWPLDSVPLADVSIFVPLSCCFYLQAPFEALVRVLTITSAHRFPKFSKRTSLQRTPVSIFWLPLHHTLHHASNHGWFTGIFWQLTEGSRIGHEFKEDRIYLRGCSI